MPSRAGVVKGSAVHPHRPVRAIPGGRDRQRRAHRPGPHRGRDRKNRFGAAGV